MIRYDTSLGAVNASKATTKPVNADDMDSVNH
jgi:hypothetical protein